MPHLSEVVRPGETRRNLLLDFLQGASRAVRESKGEVLNIRITKQDTIFSKLIRLRARWNCENCGKYFPKGHGLQCAHIFSRRHQATRHDPDNACALCFTCHQYYTGNPTLFTHWVIRNLLGEGRYEMLRERHGRIMKRTKADAEGLYQHLRAQLRALEADPNHTVVAYD